MRVTNKGQAIKGVSVPAFGPKRRDAVSRRSKAKKGARFLPPDRYRHYKSVLGKGINCKKCDKQITFIVRDMVCSYFFI